jgi:ParB family chromosome partitioning protein
MIPADVVEGTTGTPQAEIDRIFEQLDENDSRKDLTAADRARAVQELLDLGVKPTVVARKTGLSKDEVAAASKVAASDVARTLAEQYPLDLVQSAAIAEFEDDGEAVKKLKEAAQDGRGKFAHALQAARDARTDREAIAARVTELKERGITVTSGFMSYENALEQLTGPDGNRLTPETHEKCPGNVVIVSIGWSHNVRESWYCTDPKANGHKRYRFSSNGNTQSSEDRKKVLAGNKAWRSAEKVRLDWLREFLARPKAPADAVQYTLQAFALADHHLRFAMDHRASGQHATARELLGLPRAEGSVWSTPPEVYTAMTQANPQRAQVIALAIVLGAHEGQTGVHSWRNPTMETANYLETLARWGYDLSEIEQNLVTGAHDFRAKVEAAIKENEATAAAAAGDDTTDDEDSADEAGEQQDND